MSVYAWLEQMFGEGRCIRFGSNEHFEALARNPIRNWYESYTVVSGHMPLWQFESEFDLSKAFKFTVVREPFAREISTFLYLRKQHVDHQGSAISDVDDYITMVLESPHLHNLQTSYLSLNVNEDLEPAKVLLKALAARYAVFSTEKIFVLNDYMSALFQSQYRLESLNRTLEFPLTEAQRKRLRPAIEKDLELYNLIQIAPDAFLPDWLAGWELE